MWIEEYRKRNNLELDEFARRVNIVGRHMEPPLIGTVTDTLIHILEVSKVPRTHPRIANAIATVCGATAEQRDSIVDESHAGEWEPTTVAEMNKTATKPKPTNYAPNALVSSRERPVVKIDRDGRVVARYDSVSAAESDGEMSRDSIRERCNRNVLNEFRRYGYTYRYENEWKRLNAIEKLRDIGEAK